MKSDSTQGEISKYSIIRPIDKRRISNTAPFLPFVFETDINLTPLRCLYTKIIKEKNTYIFIVKGF